jgi:hypothetical protein
MLWINMPARIMNAAQADALNSVLSAAILALSSPDRNVVIEISRYISVIVFPSVARDPVEANLCYKRLADTAHSADTHNK